RREALLRLLLEEPEEERLHLLRDERIHLARRAWDVAHVSREEVRRRRGDERRRARDEVIEARPERVEVAADVDRLVAARELGRDVERRPERLAGARDVALLVETLR